MTKQAARKLVQMWLGDAPDGSAEHTKWRLDQAAETVALLPAGTAAVGVLGHPAPRRDGLAWVGHPLRVLSHDALFTLAAYEEPSDRRAREEPPGRGEVFGIDVQRFAVASFGLAGIMSRSIEREAVTRTRRSWLFFHRDSRQPFWLIEDLSSPAEGQPAPEAALARELAGLVGWETK